MTTNNKVGGLDPQQTEALRARFQDFADSIVWQNDDGTEKYIAVGNMFDWWIDEFSQALEREREAVMEELKREMTTFEIDTAGGKQEVWLKEDVLSLLSELNKGK